ncbi:MAG: YchJ family metal-binding protein [Actinomycetota bacterium]|jgi:SEC-C motif-containing protein|nr:YchJ family metal-binding protein [Actinomycetota bacterium]
MAKNTAAKNRGPKKKPTTDCPCESGDRFNSCCGPFIRRQAEPPTAEALMRSRYSAFVKRNAAYIVHSWLPSTAPESLGELPREGWDPLEIVATSAGGPGDDAGTVEFKTGYIHADHSHPMHEVGQFVRHDGRWVYSGGATPEQ